MIKSETAIKHGYGSMPHRSVSGLTQSERLAVRCGEKVYFKIPKTHYTQSGFKIVTIWHGKYDSREPSNEELAEILKLEA